MFERKGSWLPLFSTLLGCTMFQDFFGPFGTSGLPLVLEADKKVMHPISLRPARAMLGQSDGQLEKKGDAVAGGRKHDPRNDDLRSTLDQLYVELQRSAVPDEMARLASQVQLALNARRKKSLTPSPRRSSL
ncbi:hypothetical protein HHL25_17150 [Rhizobium sp. S-51]|uniref:Uncharacterized protein n=1 Tax=Rhizobium terricola TaxID=2728849 RepID=A0A7Y0AYJ6_9HYPH|nr:hypothetical protein [Rhizobium terricola]NML75862.1 hypothetical protein [Rhizobium terricola]